MNMRRVDPWDTYPTSTLLIGLAQSERSEEPLSPAKSPQTNTPLQTGFAEKSVRFLPKAASAMRIGSSFGGDIDVENAIDGR
jgi:hypothetical protein